MTMTRPAKTEHTTELITAAATGHCKAEFESPKLRRAARAERGHCRMTSREYVQHRMSRSEMPESRLALELDLRGRLRRAQRVLGGRRVTGLRPGTKRPAAWTNSTLERKFTAHVGRPYQARHAA